MKLLDKLDLQQNELQNPRAQNLASAPGSPVSGQFYYDTSTSPGILYWWDGSVWQSAKGGSPSGAAGGDLTGTFPNPTVDVNKITNAKLAQMATLTIKGNNTGGTANAADLTAAQTKTLLAIVPGDVTGFDTQVRTSRLDQMAAPTADVSLNTHKITNLVDGTATTDAATFGQLNSILQGQVWKQPVEAATTGVLPNSPTYANGTAGVGATLTAGSNAALAAQDGYTAVAADRILVKNQATAAQNGIYTVTAVGSGAAPWVLTRVTDMDAGAEFKNGTVLVLNGTTQGGDAYTETATVATVGTDTVTFTKTADTNVAYTADGTTITLTGTQFSVTTGGIANAQIAAAAAIAYSKLNLASSIVNADVAAGAAIAYSKLNLATSIVNADIAAAAAIAYSKLALSNSIVNADIASAAAIAYSKLALSGSIAAADVNTTYSSSTRVARVYATALTGGATSEVITHNLGTRDVIVQVVNNASPWDAVITTWEATTTNTVTIRGGSNLPAGYRVVVTG